MKLEIILGICLVFLCPVTCYAFAYALKAERFEQNDYVITAHGTATCFESGKLLTAAHNVVDQNKKETDVFIEVKGVWKPAIVLKINHDIDLALLECKSAQKTTSLAKNNPKEGASFVLWGSKRGKPISSHEGTVKRAWYKGFADYLADVSFDHGDSGAPLIANGKVIGIACAGLPKDGDIDTSKALFVPVVVIRTFLED